MSFGRRTTFQLAFLIMGLIIWAYGQRVDDPPVRLVGIAFLAVAFMFRFFRSSNTKHVDEPEPSEEEP